MNPTYDFSGQVALVTRASSGMGLATAEAFAAAVVLADINEKALQAAAENFDLVNGVNLRGVWACMKHELQQMRTQGSGAIVNCSSLGGLVGLPSRAAYPPPSTASSDLRSRNFWT